MIIRLFALCGFLCLASSATLVAQNSPDNTLAPAASAAPAKPSAPSNSTIGPEDQLTIVALDADEISKTWRVNSSGDLDLPMVGRVHAAGLTSEQLEKTLTEGL